jgi:putative hydrolase of the HAD superfamily
VRADDDRGWWRELVDQVLKQCGITLPTAVQAAYFDALYASFTRPGVWELFPEVDAQLTLLAKQYCLGVISNFDGRLRPILDLLGICHHFSHLVISSEIGADKPDPWIFASALHTADVAPEEALHVGDDPVRDWEGAAAAGLKVFALVRGEQTIADVAVALQSARNPDFVELAEQ